MRPVAFVLALNSNTLCITRSLAPNRSSRRHLTSYITSLYRPRQPFVQTLTRHLFTSNDDTQGVHLQITNAFSVHSNDLWTILHTSFRILEYYQSPEPLLSACHIVAFALQDHETEKPIIRWEDNYFSYLLNVVEPLYLHISIDMDQNRDLESFLRISIPPDSKIALDTTFRKPFTSSQMDHLISMIVRRVQQEPLQYIFGKWDFYDFTLLVRKPCLCPRPETEELVYLVSLDIQNMIQSFPNKYKERKIRILDVGAGTGAIGIALARMFPSHVQVVAIDIKETAIQLSRDNAQRLLQTSASHTAHPLYQAILCSAAHYTNNLFESQSSPYHFGFDIVVSNPPYIPLSDMSSLSDSVVKFEDTDALCGGVDGMDVIRIIISRLDEWWKRNSMEAEVAGYEPICWMEVDPSQPPLIRSIVDEVTSPIRFVETRRDLSGNNRFVKLSRR